MDTTNNSSLASVYLGTQWKPTEVPGVKIDQDILDYFKDKEGVFIGDVVLCQVAKDLQKLLNGDKK